MYFDGVVYEGRNGYTTTSMVSLFILGAGGEGWVLCQFLPCWNHLIDYHSSQGVQPWTIWVLVQGRLLITFYASQSISSWMMGGTTYSLSDKVCSLQVYQACSGTLPDHIVHLRKAKVHRHDVVDCIFKPVLKTHEPCRQPHVSCPKHCSSNGTWTMEPNTSKMDMPHPFRPL